MSYSSSLPLPLPLLEWMSGPYRAVLSSMRAINHMGLFKCKVLLIKIKLKISSSIALATFQVLSDYMSLVATVLQSIDTKHSIIIENLLYSAALVFLKRS